MFGSVAVAAAVGLAYFAHFHYCGLLCNPSLWKNSDTNYVIDTIVSEREKVNFADFSGATPLHYAAAFSQEQRVIEMLIESGADISARAKIDETLILDAIGHNNPDATTHYKNIVDKLLTIDEPPSNDTTPLHWASAFNANLDVISALFDAGADISARDDSGATPLHWAAGYNTHHDVILHLLSYGSDINERDDLGVTVLHAAAGNMNPVVASVLLAAGADISARGVGNNTPLFIAAALNTNPDVTRVLLAAGADINARATGDFTPLHWVAWHNMNPDVTRVLLAAGADINARAIGDYTPLHLAAGDNTNPDVTLLLLDSGANPMASTTNLLLPIDLAEDNSSIKDSLAYQRLQEASIGNSGN